MSKTVHNKLLKKFGLRVRQLREKRGMSLRDIYYAYGIDNSKVSKIENGRINVTFSTIVQLAEALEVSVTELMDFETD